MELKKDCRYFQGNKPCIFNKSTGNECCSCNKYDPIYFRILIIKLGAAGDVLRTTFILPLLKEKYEHVEIDWLVDKKNVDFLSNNQYIDNLLTYNLDSILYLQTKKYELLINLEMERAPSSLANMVDAREKLGFHLSEMGKVIPLNPEAVKYYEMACFDRIKFENRLSYQKIISNMLNLGGKIIPPIYEVRDTRFGISFLSQFNDRPICGLNLGSGSRWPSKRWPLEKFIILYEKLEENGIVPIFLLGPDESEMAPLLTNRYNIAGPDLSVDNFASILSQLSCVVSSDTMVVHLSLALNTKTIVLFSSTSPDEIELFNMGEKLVPTKKCECYYKKNVPPNFHV